MALLNFKKREKPAIVSDGRLEAVLQGYSIEVMPRTAEKVENFRDLLPERTRASLQKRAAAAALRVVEAREAREEARRGRGGAVSSS